jgi:hypothetical protein
MTFRPLAFAVLVASAALLTSASTVAAGPPADSKSSTAKPVEAPAPPEPPTPPDDSSWESGRTGVGSDVTVLAGEVYHGDVTCIHGHARIDGRVNGDVTVVAGSLEISGTITGDVVSIATHTRLAQGATIEGQLINVGGSLDRDGAKVHGQTVNIPLGVDLGPWNGWRGLFDGFRGFLFWWKLFGLFLFFVCALLLAALVPDRIRLISEEVPLRFFHALILGLLGYLLFGFVQFFLGITVIGIPLALLLYVVFVVLKWLAMCGMFHYIGSRMGRGLGRDMSLLGAIFLGFLPFALLRFLPLCVGWTIWFAIEILGFGYLIITRVGVHRSGAAVPPAVPPPAPLPS